MEPNKRYSYVNKVWLDFTGRTLEQELGDGWVEGVYADDLHRCMAVFVSSFDARLPFTTDYRLRRYDGEYRWLLDTGTPRFADDGIFLGYIGSCIDITERKQVETHLEKSLSLLHATLESASDAILVVDFNNTWILYNQNFIDLWGIPNEIIAVKDDEAALSYVRNQLEDADGFLHKVHELYHTPEASSFDIINFKSGEVIERYSMPQRINSTVVGRVWSFRDITERARAERALYRESEKNLALLRNASDGIHILDTEGNIIEVSDSFCAMLGYSRNEMIGMNVTQWDAKHSASDCIRLVRQQFAKPVRALFETCHRCKDSSIMDVEVSGFPLVLDGKPALFNSSRDITQRKQSEQALQESELKFKTLADFAYDWEYWVGKDSQIIYMSPSCERISGYKAEEFLADNSLLKKIIHPEDEKLWHDHVGKAHFFAQIHDAAELDFRIIKKDGTVAYVSHLCRPIFDDNDNSFGRRVSNRDITERKQAEIQLRIAATVFESQEGMLITDANEIILNVNKTFTQITGYSAAEVIGQTPRILSSGRHDKAFYDAIWQSIHDTGAWHGEIWNRRKNGEVYPEQLTITAVTSNNDTVTHYVSTLTDITERKAMEEYIHRLAFYDVLTQLPNRRLLQERLKHGIELNHRTGSQMAVLMMDLDRFKAVNDNLGHAAGDELLQQVAERVKARLREVDMVARLGGDEFVILLENISHYKDVAHVAQSIINTLSQPFRLCQGHEVSIGATIGIGLCPHHGNSVETLMDNADAALYHAKDQGRGCFAYFSEALTQKSHERRALESQLRGAVEQQELSLYFQPQIEMNSGRLVGAETLVYWDNPVKSCRVMLKDVIALAEETGVGVTIGEWALRETCKLGRQWLNAGLTLVPLAVNVSPYQFRSGNIKELVMQILEETGFPATYLSLEITETGLMANQEHALSILNSLDEQSVQLAINDFGTGYSSLSRLKYFPIDILKIDKTFIKNIPFSQDDSTITTTIIDMAHHLGFSVLAEGVDTTEQLVFLRLQGCDLYQGHLYSDVLSPSDFAKLLFDLQHR
jgi:diguanylate cyclase (GGDEF)-like protein/PAS domain S-box-containing protein